MVRRTSVRPGSFGFRSFLPLLTPVVSAAFVVLGTTEARAQSSSDSAAPQSQSAGRPGGAAPPTSPQASGDDLMPTESKAKPDAAPAPSADDALQVDPAKDQQKLLQQGKDRPSGDGMIGTRPSDVYSEDWWSHTRPIIEMHGYFRTRGELFHNFALGRHDTLTDSNGANLWAQPQDNSFTDRNGQRRQVLLCGTANAQGQYGECQDKSQSTANLRLRLNPEIHISDNLRILTQIDLLDNLVLGSTPDSYAIQPSGSGSTGYSPARSGYNGYAPLGALSMSQGSPTPGVNSYRNAVDVKRVWAEYNTPLGQVRFGRMPTHWGLGMVNNAGDCLDCDYQTNNDRIMVTSGLKSLDLYFGGSWDFVSTGPTNASPYDVYGGQPYNTANLANVQQWSLFAVHRTNPELQRLKLAKGDVVINGGVYAQYRRQMLDTVAGQTPITTDATTTNNGLERRGAYAFIPDGWVQLLWGKLRLEGEVATIFGSVESSPAGSRLNDPTKLRMWGFAAQGEFRAIEDKLRIQFGTGYSSGDPNVEGLAPGANGFQTRVSDGSISTFRFHPAYYVDYIFFRRIMSRIQGAYFFRPSVEYDFIKQPNGQKLGGGAAVIWSRASEFIQTPGNKRDLGVELDAQIYYQAKDGSLNDDPNKQGGFYAALQYGVFFPMSGLSYLKNEQDPAKNSDWSLSTAQTVRLILGVMF